MGVFIGVDVGTSGTKAVAVDERGTLLASTTVQYPLHSPKPGWAEQDARDWEAAAWESLKCLAGKITPAEVKAIGLTGQMHGSVFLDGDNNVLRPPLLWCDQRTARQCDEITSKVGEHRLLEMVSNPALTGFTAPKILWLRENEPQHYDKLKRVLLPKDYIRFLLTGEYATDLADASGTLLLDVKNRRWHDELLSLLQIDRQWLPRAYEGPEITGTLSKLAAQKTGLPAGIPVVAGGGDQAAGGVGCGIVRTGILSSSLGTSGVVFAHADEVRTDPQGRVHTFCHSVPGKWHVMGVVLSAGGALQWFRDALCTAEKTVAAATGADAYEYITTAAAQAPLGSEGLLFLPYLTGERSPHKDPDARGAFVGFSLRHRKPHMARAVLEGVAYAMRDCLEIIREMQVPVTRIRATGGGARSTFWRKILADSGHVPMVRINVEEGPAYGAAILAAVGAGAYGSVEEACDAIIQEVDVLNPSADEGKKYDRWFHEYQAAYKALAPGFKRAARMLL